MGVILLAIAGAVLIVAGAALTAPALGLVVAGVFAVGAAYLMGDA